MLKAGLIETQRYKENTQYELGIILDGARRLSSLSSRRFYKESVLSLEVETRLR